MRLAAAVATAHLLCAPGCARPGRVERVREVVEVHDREPCIGIPPPPAPSVNCGELERETCERVTLAAWSDYGRTAFGWINLYAWPACTDGGR
ncbi:MAG TPA: hypothetical protein VES97_02160 [Solirubrobacteraceae bacterium]|nr:hypothetical protein [Solirubrobacteraceae bacterium]